MLGHWQLQDRREFYGGGSLVYRVNHKQRLEKGGSGGGRWREFAPLAAEPPICEQ